MEGLIQKGAVVDKTELYRYSLWREWNIDAPKLVFIMLNPSKADAYIDDPTLRRCIGFAKSWGFGSLLVINLFAYRSTKPSELRQVNDPVGSQNDRYLKKAIKSADKVVVAWGDNGKLMQRDRSGALFPAIPIFAWAYRHRFAFEIYSPNQYDRW
ncbi:MAG: DUF1643 domain-containing protein [Pseudanabaena sp. CAN_BIN31]|nr:DUF1643 domain-containing protein [Pseudanabaena sp. CAN_BIN31]